MNDTTTKLPLWRNALEAMEAKGIAYGQIWPTEFFEEHLKAKRGTPNYNFGVSDVRRVIRPRGFYLNGRGMKGKGFLISPVVQNDDHARGHERTSTRQIRYGFELANGTPVELLPEKDRKPHEHLTARLATKLVLLNRHEQVAELVKKHKPKLMEP